MLTEDALAERLSLASVRLTRWLRAADPAPRLSGPQASALAVVVHAERIRMSDLARLEEVSRPTITRVASELQAMGLITRRTDPIDGRVGWLTATTEGVRFLAEGQARRVQPLKRALETLSPTERGDLATGLVVMERLVAQAISGGRV